MVSNSAGHDAAQQVADGLQRNGYTVVPNTEGHWATTTAICHGGDNATGLWFRNDDKGGLVAGCFKGSCDTRVAAPALRDAAGIAQHRRVMPQPAANWRELCIYRHPEGFTSRSTMRLDWPGGTPCTVERRRNGNRYVCEKVDPHKHVRYRPVNDGPMPEGDRYAGYLLNLWEPREVLDPTVILIAEGETDRPNLLPGVIAPRNVSRNNRDFRERLAKRKGVA